MILHNDHVVLTDSEIKEGGYDTTYVGYYLPTIETAAMANPSTGGYFNWSFKDSTKNLEVEPEV